MDNPENFTIDENICRQVMSLKLAPDAVEEALRKMGIQPVQINGYQQEIKRMRNAKRRSTGFILMAAGAFMGFLSCVLTITHALPHMFDFIFYGLTTLAVCIVVLGLYYVFE
jgi:hypothetical protein